MAVVLPDADTRWRCGRCGNLTRFDVVRTSRVREFWHLELAGDATVLHQTQRHTRHAARIGGRRKQDLQRHHAHRDRKDRQQRRNAPPFIPQQDRYQRVRNRRHSGISGQRDQHQQAAPHGRLLFPV